MVKILLTVDPRAYRETIGMALDRLRPEVEVIIEEPDNLEAALRSFEPEIVVCSEVTELVRQNTLAWIELYPEDEPHAIVRSVYGISTVNDLDFDMLIEVVDETARIIERSKTTER